MVDKPAFAPGADKFVWDEFTVVKPSKRMVTAAADRVEAMVDAVLAQTTTPLETELTRALLEVLGVSGAMVTDRLRTERRRG